MCTMVHRLVLLIIHRALLNVAALSATVPSPYEHRGSKIGGDSLKKKLTIALFVVVVLAALMFAEYRCIMCGIKPYLCANNTEVFGQVDEYYAEPVEEE